MGARLYLSQYWLIIVRAIFEVVKRQQQRSSKAREEENKTKRKKKIEDLGGKFK